MRCCARLILIALLVVGAASAARWVIHGPVNRDSLAEAVAIEAGSSFTGSQCTLVRASGKWVCGITSREGSGTVTYELKMKDDSACFDGVKVASNSEPPEDEPKTISGCVHLWQWSLL